ncbi:MAG: ABC transporter permease [Methanobacteriota archaeon]|nr:MAG: ABC transporter permease [Euryarchaeota archaeon]
MPSSFRTYFLKRTFYVFISIVLILSFNFFLFRVMPGDVTHIIIPKNPTNETVERLTEYYGLDEPLVVQYLIYMKQTFTGDFGESINYRRGAPVEDVLSSHIVKTVVLVGAGTIIAIGLGMIFGREAAWRRGTAFDRVGGAFFLVFYCIPTFLFALVLVTLFAQYVPGWPIEGEFSADYDSYGILGKFWDRTIHVLLPLLALVIESIAAFSIITRSSLMDVLTEEYMVTAVAKGLKGRQILRNHAMPNAMLPVVTVIAMNVGWILSGAIMIEIIFSYQGLGYLMWMAVIGYDYPLIQAAFLLEAVAVIVANFIADITLFKLDPRLKI